MDLLLFNFQKRSEYLLVPTIAELRTELLALAIFLDDDELAAMTVKHHILPPLVVYHVHHLLSDVVGIVVHHHTKVAIHGLCEMLDMLESLALLGNSVIFVNSGIQPPSCSVRNVNSIRINEGTNPLEALAYGLYVDFLWMQVLVKLFAQIVLHLRDQLYELFPCRPEYYEVVREADNFFISAHVHEIVIEGTLHEIDEHLAH